MELNDGTIGEYAAAIGGALKEEYDAFAELLLFYNGKYNLTAITEKNEVFYKHFVDSVAGERFFPKGATVAEVGSGAGFPSVPLAIYRRDLTFHLFESTGKKCEFLRVAARELGLKSLVVHNLRAEEAAKSREFRETFDVCTARAVAKVNTLAEYCIPFVKTGGEWIAYKGASAEEETREGERAVRLLGGGTPRLIGYTLPEGFGRRALVISEKIAPTPAKYPRGNGRERRNPL